MQIGRVVIDSAGPLVGLLLDRVTGDEPRRQPEVTEHLNQEPGEVATRSMPSFERLVRGEDPRLHANVVAKAGLDAAIQIDQDVDHAAPRPTVLRSRALDELGE